MLDLRTVSPIDREAVAKSVRKTNKVVIVHEEQKIGGVGAEVAAFIAEELFEKSRWTCSAGRRPLRSGDALQYRLGRDLSARRRRHRRRGTPAGPGLRVT